MRAQQQILVIPSSGYLSQGPILPDLYLPFDQCEPLYPSHNVHNNELVLRERKQRRQNRRYNRGQEDSCVAGSNGTLVVTATTAGVVKANVEIVPCSIITNEEENSNSLSNFNSQQLVDLTSAADLKISPKPVHSEITRHKTPPKARNQGMVNHDSKVVIYGDDDHSARNAVKIADDSVKPAKNQPHPFKR